MNCYGLINFSIISKVKKSMPLIFEKLNPLYIYSNVRTYLCLKVRSIYILHKIVTSDHTWYQNNRIAKSLFIIRMIYYSLICLHGLYFQSFNYARVQSCTCIKRFFLRRMASHSRFSELESESAGLRSCKICVDKRFASKAAFVSHLTTFHSSIEVLHHNLRAFKFFLDKAPLPRTWSVN